MDEIPVAPPRDREDLELLRTCLDHATDGVALAYRVLDRVGERLGADPVALVARPDGLGPQVFFRGGAVVDGHTVGDLALRPSGLLRGDGELLDDPLSDALTRTCELALEADLARQRAADGPEVLAPRTVLRQSMARAAARSARYGWAHTAVLLTLDGGMDEPGASAAFGAAVRQAARVGDEVGWAAPGCAMALLGNAGADAVRPFLDRVDAGLAAAGAAAGASAGRVEFAIVGMPRETVDPEEAWRLVTDRLAERVGRRPAREGPWAGALPSSLELELRALDGVVSVGTTGRGLAEAPQLTVVALQADPELHDEVARRVAEWFGADAVPVVTVGPGWAPAAGSPATNGHHVEGSPPSAVAGRPAGSPSPAGAPPGTPRVALLGAHFDAATGTSEVVLGRGAGRAVARAAGGPLAGAAQATLSALGQLGVDVPYYLRTVERLREVDGGPVVVVLSPRRPGPPQERMGVAVGDDEASAAGKATLGALNRFLAAGGTCPTAP